MSKKAYNSDMSKRTLIVDFMYLWNRVYAIRGNETPKLVLATLKSMENSMYYDDKYIVLDGTNSVSLRRKVYPEYKASRGDKSDIYKLLNQFLQDISKDFKELKIIRNNNFEADDVITYLVKNSDSIVHIYSGDTDLFQLMRFPCTHVGTDYKRVGTFILTPIHEEEAKERYFKRYGINVKNMSYITKCKAFKGDTSDNIPIACPGMKAKTIEAMLNECWSEDTPLTSDIMRNMHSFLKEHGTAKEQSNFYEHRKDIIRNYKLTQLGYIDFNVAKDLKRLNKIGEWDGFQLI